MTSSAGHSAICLKFCVISPICLTQRQHRSFMFVFYRLFVLDSASSALCPNFGILLLFKVFRFQRKTLLFSYGTFFVIFKVSRFQRKTFLLFYCFFFSIIIIFFLTDFCAEHSSKTDRPICMKFSGLI